jgi:hypothetical protein
VGTNNYARPTYNGLFYEFFVVDPFEPSLRGTERGCPHFASDVSSALFRMDIECLSNWYIDGRIK